MKHYKSVEFLLNLNVKPHCTNVKPPRTNPKPPTHDFLATVLLGTLCWLNGGVEKFPSSSSSTVLEQRHSVEEIPSTSGEYRVVSSTNSCSFPVGMNGVMFHFLITSLWRDFRLRVVFKFPRVEAFCAVPIRLSRFWVSLQLPKVTIPFVIVLAEVFCCYIRLVKIDWSVSRYNCLK